ncbi:Imm21 family immunity protein [Actinoplanes subtropicus]|uniref:Imm21 family immunity protein n=1 Tax=Actinoplanes subtropicus TaxID=543632 RepID=UPI00069128C3|nr:Imm21 family immunity protein [Actinoplanes subtropicus]
MEDTWSTSRSSAGTSPVWVESMGGPLLVMPVSALGEWGGCTQEGMLAGTGDVLDDYDRACELDGLAGVIAVGGKGRLGLVLADEPARTCYLPEYQTFVRWLGADCEADLVDAAKDLLDDPAVDWEECGIWETDGPAVLMDSATAGIELNVAYPDDGAMPEQAHIPIPPGRWRVRAVHTRANEETLVGLVQLLALSQS